MCFKFLNKSQWKPKPPLPQRSTNSIFRLFLVVSGIFSCPWFWCQKIKKTKGIAFITISIAKFLSCHYQLKILFKQIHCLLNFSQLSLLATHENMGKHRVSDIFSGVNPSRSDPERREKINWNFYFHTSLWCLIRFMKALKTFIKSFEAPQGHVKIKV